jgi:hypothetical protein
VGRAVSRLLFTVAARVRSLAGPCEICGGQSGTNPRSSPSSSVFPLSLAFYHRPIYSYSSITDPIKSQYLTASFNGTYQKVVFIWVFNVYY